MHFCAVLQNEIVAIKGSKGFVDTDNGIRPSTMEKLGALNVRPRALIQPKSSQQFSVC